MRGFSKLNLPGLAKYGEIKFDFKNLKENLAFYTNNTANRGSTADPRKTIALWETYKKDLYDLDLLRKRKNQHAEM